jgi:undecaprenyl-diphosphatase
MAVIVVVTCWPFLGRLGRVALAVMALLGALAVAASRLVGGVHWPSDVVAGLLLTMAVASIVAAVLPVNPLGAPTPR